MTIHKQASPNQMGGEYQKRVEARLETLRDDGFSELIEVMRVVIPEDVLGRWEEQYQPPKYIRVDIDSICTRCGAVIYEGARKQHKRWHKYLTFSMWMMQSGILQALGTVGEAGEEVERP